MNRVIQGLWIGETLSCMERLSISSFLANGHDYHLYVYDDVAGVPRGTVLRDASRVIPRSMIFQYRDRPSYAGFANFFRYQLLLDNGGWWVDTDVVCLRPFLFDSDCVLATQRDAHGREFVTSGIIKAPRNSELMRRAWQACQSANPQELRWGETGPDLMHHLTLRLALCRYVQEADVFCPIDTRRWFEALVPRRYATFSTKTMAVHLWNELWRLNNLDKDEEYAPNCLYERLKREYLLSSEPHSIAATPAGG